MRYKDLQQVGTVEEWCSLMEHFLKEAKPFLYEDDLRVIDYQNFLDNTRATLPSLPIVGQKYCPLGIGGIPTAEIIIIQTIDLMVEFIKYQPKVQKFVFKDETGKEIKFPAASKDTLSKGDYTINTLLFESITASTNFQTMLFLKFGSWKFRKF